MAKPVAMILAQCLEAIERGEMTPAECLVRHPDLRDELAPLLEVAAAIQHAAVASPHPAFRRTARARLQRRLTDRTPVTFLGRLRFIWQTVESLFVTRRYAMSWMLALALVVTLVGGSSTVYASGNALPGDALYPVKTTVENVRLALADDSENVSLYLRFTGSRVGELESLIGADRAGDVPEAVDRFERQVDGAVDVLSKLAAEDAELARGLAVELDEGLSAYVVALTYLLDAAPQDARPAIESAVDDLHDGHERLEALFPDDIAGDADDDGALDDGPDDVDDSVSDDVDDDADDDVDDDSDSDDVDDDSDDSGSDDVDDDSDSGSDDDSDSDSGSDDDSDSDGGSDDDHKDEDDESKDEDDGSDDDGDSDGGSDDDHKDEDDESKDEDDESKDED